MVTGASSGIGEAAAFAFAKRGARVVLAARRTERLDAVQVFYDRRTISESVRRLLKKCADVERCVQRISLGTARNSCVNSLFSVHIT